MEELATYTTDVSLMEMEISNPYSVFMVVKLMFASSFYDFHYF